MGRSWSGGSGGPGHWDMADAWARTRGKGGLGGGTAGAGVGPDGHDLGRRAFPEESLLVETCIAIPAVGIEDPKRGSPARRTGPTARDDDIGGLPDDIASEPDP